MLNAIYSGASIGAFFLGIMLPFKMMRWAKIAWIAAQSPTRNYTVTWKGKPNET